MVLGTFLARRDDVLRKVMQGILALNRDATVIVGAWPSADSLADLQNQRVFIENFVPQKALIPHMDLVIHHGGVGSFTETLYYGKPALIMPFSSDQFAVAYDGEGSGVARVLNPNTMKQEDICREIHYLLAGSCAEKLAQWRQYMEERGPAYGVARIQQMK